MNAVMQEEKRKSWRSVPQRLENKTKMLLMVEVAEEAKAVELVVGISVVQLPEELQLFQTGFLPVYQKHVLQMHNKIQRTFLYFILFNSQISKFLGTISSNFSKTWLFICDENVAVFYHR